jgi:hypothetical protein
MQVRRKAAMKGGQPFQITRNGGEFAYESPDRELIYYLKPTIPDLESSSLWKMPALEARNGKYSELFSTTASIL